MSRIVINTLFVKCLTDSLGDAAVNLPVHDHGIDDAPEIIASGESHHLHNTGVGIDFDFADVATGREREILRIVKRGLFQSWLQRLQRIVMRHVCGHGDVAKGDGSIRSGHRKLPILELDIFLRRLE